MACQKIMLFRKQTGWEIGGVILICWYLAAPAVAQCNPEWCGSQQNVSYPFWISNPSCGRPGFQIKCSEKENGNSSLFLGVLVNGTATKLEILEIDYAGFLIVNSTDLKAMSCNYTDDASVLLELPADGPFTIYTSNKFVVIGCSSTRSFTLNGQLGKCEAACLNQQDPSYCNLYGCCEAAIPGDQRVIKFTGGGIKYKEFPECGFSTILDPDTWKLPKGELGFFARGHYGMRLKWDIDLFELLDGQRDSQLLLRQCSRMFKRNTGRPCTGCTDVNDCNQGENECVEPSEGRICRNLPGTYYCSCAKDYSGNGFQNGTRSQSPSSNNSVRSAIIGSVSHSLEFHL
ncbi:hypothetical protein SUGI_0460230 [Cryptomeria japonica]|nr:hypothetical protein SUGI_0460230 [Cryptomeria japonica]